MDKPVGPCETTYKRMMKAMEMAQQFGIYFVLKGKWSIIVCPDGTFLLNPTGNPGMATAGSGDVLTGILTSLLAQGYSSLDAVRLGVYLHGLAGDFAAEELGEESVIASDIINNIPKAFKKLKNK
jgi:NAD(P)H-hydrate epimerase